MGIIVSRERIQEVVDYLDKDVEVREYVGRGMFGHKSCLGIVTTDVSGLVEFVAATAYTVNVNQEYDLDDFLQRIGVVVEDKMGLNTIYYWPNVQLS